MTSVDPVAWKSVQDAIWACKQTDPPPRRVKLLLVGIAPPFEAGIAVKTRARSVIPRQVTI